LICAASIAVAGVLSGFGADKQPSRQPVYIYLFSRFSDFYNIEMTEGRMRDTVALVESYRRDYPQSGASVTMLFSGAMSKALAERNTETGIKDYLVAAGGRGLVEFGYDGADEPTYSFRPYPDLSKAKSPEERWRARGDAGERFLTESRDPVTGVVQAGKSGGLRAMQEVFGEAVCIRGLTPEFGGDSEHIHHLRRHNTKAIVWGLPDPDPSYNIHGYRGSVEQFGKAMSPIPTSSPEVNWIDNVLRLSETSDAGVRVVSAREGPDVLKKLVDRLDRSHVRFVHVEVGDVRMYLSQFYEKGELYPPIKVAYNHPNQPKLPPEAIADDQQHRESTALQDALMKWLAKDYFPANPGSRFVSSSEVAKMAPSNTGRNISIEQLETAVKEMLDAWGTLTYLPDYLAVGDEYLSMADTFEVLCNVLAEQHRSGKQPQSVRIHNVYGPLQTPSEHGPALGEVSSAAVARVCAQMAGQLNDETWKEVPGNVVPIWIEVDGLKLTAGQFLRLMAESLIAPSPDTRIKVKMTYYFSGQGLAYPKTRLPIDQGGTWTFKPAPLHLAALSEK
jgi:hypothetical protein